MSKDLLELHVVRPQVIVFVTQKNRIILLEVNVANVKQNTTASQIAKVNIFDKLKILKSIWILEMSIVGKCMCIYTL